MRKGMCANESEPHGVAVLPTTAGTAGKHLLYTIRSVKTTTSNNNYLAESDSWRLAKTLATAEFTMSAPPNSSMAAMMAARSLSLEVKAFAAST
mmetsp:Transcript_67609/g.147240  ORF Transcript_67609/g.147240 Transcript_67609/m.147240 type:complete len:94 (+) Transcript_67609:280-561(+)